MSAQPQPAGSRLRKARVRTLIADLKTQEVPATHPAVDRMLRAYRLRFGLGPRDMSQERAHRWRALVYRKKVVAVFGERDEGPNLEVTDAYFEGRAGKVAFLAQCYAYLAMVENEQINALIHTILTRNVQHWNAVIRATGELPEVLVFVHRKKGGIGHG